LRKRFQPPCRYTPFCDTCRTLIVLRMLLVKAFSDGVDELRRDEGGSAMQARRYRSKLWSALLVTVVLLMPVLHSSASVAASTPDGSSGGRDRRFFTALPNPGALKQIFELLKARDFRNAALIQRMIKQPQAEWFTGGTPREVERDVRRTMFLAAHQRAVAVLVAYNIPFRDCAQFSAGGATNRDEYLAWIDGFAEGIGHGEAVVILEPDGLGIIPYYTDINGNTEWCQPPEADPETAAADRFFMLNAAVDRLNEQPNVSIYLDGTHSAWLSVGDAARRLVDAGVERASGFFVNVSNYRFTEHLVKYGTWISKCIAFAGNGEEGGWRLGHYEFCGSQYFPADPNDFSTWHLTDEWYDANLGTAVPTTHFIIDTSRNGRGHWTPPSYPDPQDWCNPPGRGLGPRPTARTGIPLIDAFLWVKIPGESDGECTRGLGPAGSTVDPEWGQVDPPAGRWFPAQALQLAQLAAPPLFDHDRR
jgi:endoglucanase